MGQGGIGRLHCEVRRRSRWAAAHSFNRSPVRFSIIVPTFGRPQRLRRCLEGIGALDFPSDDFEVIVVDDGADAATRAVVDVAATSRGVRYLAQPERRGPAAARDAGATHARGDFLAFIDDDCVPEPEWLRQLDEARRAYPGASLLLGGRTVNGVPENIHAEASQLLVDFLYEWYNADPTHAAFFTSNNMACDRGAFVRVGGFDTTFRRAAAEDRDLCDRWREHGLRLVLVRQAIVRHFQRSSLSGFVRQHQGYGRGAVDLHLARQRRGVGRPRLESLRFYWRLVTFAVGRGYGVRTPALVALAFLSQVVYAYGYFSERWRRRGQHAEPSPSVILAEPPSRER